MDDGVIVGDARQLSKALLHLAERFGRKGLRLNLAKCELWGPILCRQPTPQLPDSVPSEDLLRQFKRVAYVPQSGITILGSPVEHPEGEGHHTHWLWQDRL